MQFGRVYEIISEDTVDSTSAMLRRMLPGVENLTVVVSRTQTGGRGQFSRKWHSASGKNLTFSIFLKYSLIHPFPAAEQHRLSMASALSVIDFMADFGIDARIKKPNDIYVGSSKICGILIENSLLGEYMDWSIVGVGINVNQTAFPADLPNPVSMLQLSGGGKEYDLKECLEIFLERFDRRLGQIWENPAVLEGEFNSKIIALQQ